MPFCEYVISTIDSITQGKIVELVYITVTAQIQFRSVCTILVTNCDQLVL